MITSATLSCNGLSLPWLSFLLILEATIEKREGQAALALLNSVSGKKARRAELLLLHFTPATLYGAGSSFSHDHLRTAFAAEIHFPKLIGHTDIPPA